MILHLSLLKSILAALKEVGIGSDPPSMVEKITFVSKTLQCMASLTVLNNITIAGLILEVVTFWRLTSTLMFSLTLCKALSFQSPSAIEMAR